MEELVLDGNAIGGLLGEAFAVEATVAGSRCAGCGAVAEVGALRVYGHAPGVVVRCAGCGAVLARAVRGPDRIWLELSGLPYLELRL